MRILRQCFFSIPAHLQLVMAASAVAYVESACRIVLGRGAGVGWLCAAGFGTLGLYLLDGVRSADHEDAVSQPGRADICRRHRGVMSLSAIAALLVAGLGVWTSRPSVSGWLMLAGLAFLGLSHLLPILRRGGVWCTIKSLPLLKPLVISLAWLLGAFLVCHESVATGEAWSATRWSGFTVATLPLLLLDSIWLDHRDRLADVRFGRPSLFGSLAPGAFLRLRLLLFGLPVLSLLSPSVSFTWLSLFLLGAMGLVWWRPDRLRSEAARVWVAAGWRFTGLAGACLAAAVSPG